MQGRCLRLKLMRQLACKFQLNINFVSAGATADCVTCLTKIAILVSPLSWLNPQRFPSQFSGVSLSLGKFPHSILKILSQVLVDLKGLEDP